MAQNVSLEQLGAAYRTGHEERTDDIEAATYRAALRGVPIVASDTPVDRGRARAGWDVRPVPGGADLYNSVSYIGVLEAGSRPHMPPYEPIARWVVRKKGIDLQGGARHFNSFSEIPWKTHQFIQAVRETIAEEGAEPHWMVKNNLPKLRDILQQEVERNLS